MVGHYFLFEFSLIWISFLFEFSGTLLQKRATWRRKRVLRQVARFLKRCPVYGTKLVTDPCVKEDISKQDKKTGLLSDEISKVENDLVTQMQKINSKNEKIVTVDQVKKAIQARVWFFFILSHMTHKIWLIQYESYSLTDIELTLKLKLTKMSGSAKTSK